MKAPSRRRVLAGAAALAVPLKSAAQQPRMARVGWIGLGSPNATSAFFESLREGMRDLGYAEGKTVTYDARWVETVRDRERIGSAVRELRVAGVRAIATQGPVTTAVGALVKDIPVVFGYSGNPVLAGFAESLARPGRNMTGVSFMSLEVTAKRVQLLKEAAPKVSRVALISFPEHPGEAQELDESQRAATAAEIKLSHHLVHAPADFESAFKAIAGAETEAILALPNALIMQERARIIAFGMGRRIPAISGWSDFARSGGLFTFGPNLNRSFRRLAYFVDRILKGTDPAELPIELPTAFELVVNLRTAKALALAIPESFLLRADEVIE